MGGLFGYNLSGMLAIRALPVALSLAVLAAVCGCTSDDTETLSPTTETPQEMPPDATPCVSPETCVTPVEESNLTGDEIAFAIEAAEADATLQRVLGHAEYEVNVGSQAWKFGNDITFVSVNFSPSEPLPVNADLPRLDTGSRGGEADPTRIILPSAGYVVEIEHYEVDALALSALVYMQTGEVVQIFPVPFPLQGPDTGSP